MQVLSKLRKECEGEYLKDLIDKGDNIVITCPFHKDGKENKPSCFVYTRDDHHSVVKGTYHCFTCGAKGQLPYLVAHCMKKDLMDSEQWLIDNFSDIFIEHKTLLPPIEIDKPKYISIDEGELLKYAFYHPYMWERKLSRWAVDTFRVGYD